VARTRTVIDKAFLERHLAHSVAQARQARAAYDNALSAGPLDRDQALALLAAVKRADSLVCATGRQLLAVIINDKDYEPRVVLTPRG
jgi:hypothetical protein